MQKPQQNSIYAHALWIAEKARVEIRRAELPALPLEGSARIRQEYSGISRGTERLVFQSLIPHSEYERMRCPLQKGAFSYPVKYGYCAVGVVEALPNNASSAFKNKFLGKRVFSLAPHQDIIDVPLDLLSALPNDLPIKRALLCANMETALNAIWDSNLKSSQNVAVIGGGIVGLLTAYVAATHFGAAVTLIDINPARAELAKLFGCAFSLPEAISSRFEVIFHSSATESGLTTALNAAAFEAKIVEMSWFGNQAVSLPLGGAFHSQRLSLIASQVGHIAPLYRKKWTYAKRRAEALRLLCDAKLDVLLENEIAFTELSQEYSHLVDEKYPALMIPIRY